MDDDRFVRARLTCSGTRYTFLPVLDAPISREGGLWTVEAPELGLYAVSATRAHLEQTVAAAFHTLWLLLVETSRTDFSPRELAVRNALIWRVRATRGPADEPTRCPPRCLGGQGCRCGTKRRR